MKTTYSNLGHRNVADSSSKAKIWKIGIWLDLSQNSVMIKKDNLYLVFLQTVSKSFACPVFFFSVYLFFNSERQLDRWGWQVSILADPSRKAPVWFVFSRLICVRCRERGGATARKKTGSCKEISPTCFECDGSPYKFGVFLKGPPPGNIWYGLFPRQMCGIKPVVPFGVSG